MVQTLLDTYKFNEKDIHLLNLKLETQLTINVISIIIYVYLVY